MPFRFLYRTADFSALSRSLEISCSVHNCKWLSGRGLEVRETCTLKSDRGRYPQGLQQSFQGLEHCSQDLEDSRGLKLCFQNLELFYHYTCVPGTPSRSWEHSSNPWETSRSWEQWSKPLEHCSRPWEFLHPSSEPEATHGSKITGVFGGLQIKNNV